MRAKNQWQALRLANGKVIKKFVINKVGDIKCLPQKRKNKNGKVIYYKGYDVAKQTTKFGYLRVNLQIDGVKNQWHLIHRLVAYTFIENADPMANVVNHIDHDRTSNNVKNLEWLTQQQNMLHCFGYVYKDFLKAYRKHSKKIYQLYCQNKAIVTICKTLQLPKTIVTQLLAEEQILNDDDIDDVLFGGQ